MVRFLLAALIAGLAAGMFMTAAQMVRVVPLIMQAEIYEEGGMPAAHGDGHAHGDATGVALSRDGWARHGQTLLANLVVAVGFSLLLTAAILVLNQPMDWKTGLFWGLGGFAAFVLAPNLGLPPVLPGTVASDLYDRQIWWVATAAATAIGLLILAYRQKPVWVAAALALITAPHVWGAPDVVPMETEMPAKLAADFAIATVVTSGLFWVVLGLLLGQLLGRAMREEGAV